MRGAFIMLCAVIHSDADLTRSRRFGREHLSICKGARKRLHPCMKMWSRGFSMTAALRWTN
ncbi:MAG TPA: hypothetical protein VM115_06260 [Vicinamibacterales bacterium]|nr:hypothetical protein [Vicinamibacterales bacterium]